MATKLVKHIKFPLALIMSMAIAGSCNGATDYSTNTTSYKSSDQIFPNPEIGFWSPSEPIDRNPASPLQLSDLQKVRSQNMTLVRRIYLLSEFKDKPISQSFLDGISKDCETARKAGVKLIVRFTYNWVGGGEDAPRDRILAHLEQLKPIFKDNYDAIAYMEAGFIGYWGQWNRSTNNLVDYALSVTNDARAIFSKILNVLPTSRMVLLPYPKQKMEYFNTTNPLSATEAFNRSERARTGSHNDGFLAGSDDWGFYTYANVERDKAFLNLDNLYVVHGGETANSNSDAQPYIGCSNALKELARLRWSTLNSFDKGYGDGLAVLQKWEKDGCMPEIKRRLGYRFRLLNSSVPRKVKPAGTFSMKFEIANDGWASPYNPRRLEAILRNRQTGNEYYLRVNESPRKWMPGATKIVNIVGGIPANMPAGEYQVLLNLPDPTPRLYNRSAYSIRLANQDVWEASTGYNSLLQSVIVNSSAGGSRYSGSQFFKSR